MSLKPWQMVVSVATSITHNVGTPLMIDFLISITHPRQTLLATMAKSCLTRAKQTGSACEPTPTSAERVTNLHKAESSTPSYSRHRHPPLRAARHLGIESIDAPARKRERRNSTLRALLSNDKIPATSFAQASTAARRILEQDTFNALLSPVPESHSYTALLSCNGKNSSSECQCCS